MKRLLPLIPLALAVAWWVYRQRVAAVPPSIPFLVRATLDGDYLYPYGDDGGWTVTC